MSYISICVNQQKDETFTAASHDLGTGQYLLALRLGQTSIIFRGYNEEAVDAAREACVALQIATTQLERVCRQKREQDQEIADAAVAR